jgi:hypothetical protein
MEDWFQASGKTIKTCRQRDVTPAFSLTEFLEGRKNEEAYAVFFEHFVPCATKKTVWDLRLKKNETNHGQAKVNRLCSISDKALRCYCWKQF